jgi:phosphotransferase system HPr-like phosphotransfer protein
VAPRAKLAIKAAKENADLEVREGTEANEAIKELKEQLV